MRHIAGLLTLLTIVVVVIGIVVIVPKIEVGVSTNTLSDTSHGNTLASLITKDSEVSSRTASFEKEEEVLASFAWIPFWDQENAFRTVQNNADLFDYIGVFWYYVDIRGDVVRYTAANEDRAIIDFAHKNDIKVLALVANLPDYTEGGDWDARRVDRIIGNSAARHSHIKQLIRLLDRRQFDGIHIDYETLHVSQKESFTEFIKELGNELHSRGKLLTVALHPKTSEDNPQEDNGSRAQDWVEIAKYADQLQFMTYEEHYTDSHPGPVASLMWVNKVMQYAKSLDIPSSKLFLGVPLYGYDWEHTKENEYKHAHGLVYKNIEQIIDRFEITPHFDAQIASPHFTYEEDGTAHEVWYENTQSFKAKLGLAKALGLGGVAFWRLGGEDPSIWGTLREEIGR